MLFLTKITVNLPTHLAPEELANLRTAERDRVQELMKTPLLVHLWRIAGRLDSICVFDVESIDELHEIIVSLPMFQHLDAVVTPLASHSFVPQS